MQVGSLGGGHHDSGSGGVARGVYLVGTLFGGHCRRESMEGRLGCISRSPPRPSPPPPTCAALYPSSPPSRLRCCPCPFSPNARNPRDLDISIDYHFEGKHGCYHRTQEYRMR